MTHVLKTALAAMLLASTAHAQTPGKDQPRAFGHWEGLVSSPIGSAPLVIDIGADETGKRIATLTLPGQNVADLPLGNIKLDGDSVAFTMPIANEGSFRGALAADGQSLSGAFDKGFETSDISLTRSGEARFPPPLKNPAIDARYEGVWTGQLGGEVGPVLRVILTNKAEGAVGAVVVDEGVAIPLSISQHGDELKLDIASTGEAMTVRLDTAGDLFGNFVSGGGGRLPLKLRRVRKS